MRPFRFGLVHTGGPVADLARRAEDEGYDTLLFPDHLGCWDPFVAAVAATAATTRLRAGSQVVNNELRNVGLLAQSAASAHVLSGGRFELGIGTGYAAEEHEAIGQVLPGAGDRVDRLAATVDALRRLAAGEEVDVDEARVRLARVRLSGSPPADGEDGPMPLVPDPLPAAMPVMVGGNGDRLLGLAARLADTVQFVGFSATDAGPSLTHFSFDGLADRHAVVRAAAGDRFDDLELSALVQYVVPGDTPVAAAATIPAVQDGRLDAEAVLDSPFVLLGPPPAMVDRLSELRDRFGISYVTVFESRQERFAEVVAALAGR
ncbi:MAG TPA: TIGR03621 family F420-dependent LLM class oxidoreductase [Acidimicrobiales bacterium]|jgi:probable F420-dependent oxidoreductase